MSKRRRLSRRDFLKMVGVAASAATVEACTPQTPAKVAPTATAESALDEVKPIVSEMVLVEAGSFQMGSIICFDFSRTSQLSSTKIGRKTQ